MLRRCASRNESYGPARARSCQLSTLRCAPRHRQMPLRRGKWRGWRGAAEGLVRVLRERAPRAEELRRLPDETIADLHRTGLFRILQPGRVGGSELPFRSIVELVAVIGRGCGSP